jgi:hypothetical protein
LDVAGIGGRKDLSFNLMVFERSCKFNHFLVKDKKFDDFWLKMKKLVRREIVSSVKNCEFVCKVVKLLQIFNFYEQNL